MAVEAAAKSACDTPAGGAALAELTALAANPAPNRHAVAAPATMRTRTRPLDTKDSPLQTEGTLASGTPCCL
ncbi:hypothetical protein GCM10009765_13080 [Fodinicola feengrottensis]|uniref:Uncharacterized protein n=1 Tax=Fodinicola feengrottensis TaxID=435914 RepID=A0ABP4S6X2_9ACTN